MNMPRHRRSASLVSLAVIGAAALALSGCATSAQDGSAAAAAGGLAAAKAQGMDASLYAKAVAEAKRLKGSQQLDKSIEYIGGASGSEAKIVEALYGAFTDGTGTKITYEESGSSVATKVSLDSRIAAGNPPAVTDLSMGEARRYAKAGNTLDLTSTIGASALSASYSKSLLDDLSYDGKVFGVTQGLSNFMVWYNPTVYSGPKTPTTWKQVTDWTDTTAKAGKQPWCIAEEDSTGSGFPGTQFIESIFAKTYGAAAVTAWGNGTLKWTSPEVKKAWQEFGSIAGDDTKVSGGVKGALSTDLSTGSNGLVASPATCQLDLWGSWVPGLIGSAVKPGQNLDFFKMPAIDPSYASTEIYNANATVVLKSTPTTKAFIRFLASDAAQALLASADHWTSADKNVPASTYSSVLLKKAASTYFNDTVTLVAPPDIAASGSVDAAFNKGVVTYLTDPSSLDSVLQTIQAAQDKTS